MYVTELRAFGEYSQRQRESDDVHVFTKSQGQNVTAQSKLYSNSSVSAEMCLAATPT